MSENTTDKAMRLNTIAPAEGAKHPKRRVGRGIGSFAKFNAEIRLSDLQRLPIDEIDLLALKQAGIVAELTRAAKVIKSGELSRKITLRGVAVTAGAKAAIEAAGGNVIIDPPVEKPKKLPSKRV